MMRAFLLAAFCAMVLCGASQASAAAVVVPSSWNYATPVAPYGSAYYAPGHILYPATIPAYITAPSPPPPPIYIDAAYGRYCRSYSHIVNRYGRLYERFGTVCLRPDGSWRAVH